MKTFGSVLKGAIQRKKFTLDATAKAVGTYKGYISGICSRKLNPPSPKMIRRICKALDLDVNEMLARAAFEKLPEGLPYSAVRNLIVEAELAGHSKAPGKLS
jgi:transcriptional regulator with XRE-family HTH domain